MIRHLFYNQEVEELDLSRFRSMAVDSLVLLETISGLRKHFHLELSVNDIANVGTFGELARVILQALEAK